MANSNGKILQDVEVGIQREKQRMSGGGEGLRQTTTICSELGGQSAVYYLPVDQ